MTVLVRLNGSLCMSQCMGRRAEQVAHTASQVPTLYSSLCCRMASPVGGLGVATPMNMTSVVLL